MNVLSAFRKGQPSATPKNYAAELGWSASRRADGIVYTGHFRAAGLRYGGWVLQQNSGKLIFYISKPPITWLRDTEFAYCFHPANDNWWLVAFKPSDTPTDVSSGIAGIQKALFRAFEGRAAKRRAQR